VLTHEVDHEAAIAIAVDWTTEESLSVRPELSCGLKRECGLHLARVCLGVPKAEDGRIAFRFCCSATIEQTQEHQVYNGKNPLRSSRTTTTTTTTCHEEDQKLHRKRIKDSKTHTQTHTHTMGASSPLS